MRLAMTLGMVCLALAAPAQASGRGAPTLPLAEQLPVELRLVQQELEVDVNRGDAGMAAAQGGLLAGLVMSGINKASTSNAQERSQRLRDLLLDYPFNERVERELRDRFGAQISPAPRFHISRNARLVQDAELPDGVPVDGLLVVTPRYAMSQNFENLQVQLQLAYVDRQLNRRGQLVEKRRFQRGYVWNYEIESPSGSRASEDALLWAGLGRERLETMIDHGIVHVVALMNHDLSETGLREAAGRPRDGTFERDGVFVYRSRSPLATLTGYAEAAAPLAPSPFGDPDPETAGLPVPGGLGQAGDGDVLLAMAGDAEDAMATLAAADATIGQPPAHAPPGDGVVEPGVPVAMPPGDAPTHVSDPVPPVLEEVAIDAP